MKWSENAWSAIAEVYAKTLESPFIKELASGELDRDKFAFYIRQDALYIADFCKALAVIASRTDNPEHRATILGFAGESVAVETALHQTLLAEYDGGRPVAARQSPTCLLYTSYLLRHANEPVEVMMAAVLPCFWIYKEVGENIKANQAGNNPYQDWINTYGDEAYAQSVAKAITICDSMAESATEERRQAMTNAFVACSKMEWLFWNSAYNLEQWAI